MHHVASMDLSDICEIQSETQSSRGSDQEHEGGFRFRPIKRRQSKQQAVAKNANQRVRNSEYGRVNAAIDNVAIETGPEITIVRLRSAIVVMQGNGETTMACAYASRAIN